jgi:predicted enzyme related to lactoylglutathione lyase
MSTFTRELTTTFELDPANGKSATSRGRPGRTELSTPNPEAAAPGGDYAVASVDGHGVGGVRAPQPGEDTTPRWRTYVAVEDAGELARRVEAAGGTLTTEMDMPEVGRLVAFEHPAAGEILALEYLRPFS